MVPILVINLKKATHSKVFFIQPKAIFVYQRWDDLQPTLASEFRNWPVLRVEAVDGQRWWKDNHGPLVEQTVTPFTLLRMHYSLLGCDTDQINKPPCGHPTTRCHLSGGHRM